MSLDTFVLYRFFAGDDRLLYVGMTRNPSRRFEKHSGEKSWWSEVARIEMEHHSTLPELREAERQAIQHDKPIHNIRMNNGTVGKPRPVSRCGLTVGSVYALGLDDGECPVGLVESLDDSGVTLTLYSWMVGLFDLSDTWVPYCTIKRWVRADKMSKDAAMADGWHERIAQIGVFAMDPLADFQMKWTGYVAPDVRNFARPRDPQRKELTQ